MICFLNVRECYVTWEDGASIVEVFGCIWKISCIGHREGFGHMEGIHNPHKMKVR